jgi:hypothetical protein
MNKVNVSGMVNMIDKFKVLVKQVFEVVGKMQMDEVEIFYVVEEESRSSGYVCHKNEWWKFLKFSNLLHNL